MQFLLFILSFLPTALPSPPPSGDLLCRACGATLFHSSDHIHGALLGGPRVADVTPAPFLGEGGTLHRLRKATSETSVDVAVYAAAQGLAVGRDVAPPLLPGFQQRRTACGRCGAAVGWRFLHEAHVDGATAQISGGEIAGLQPQSTTPHQPLAAAPATPPLPGESIEFVAAEETRRLSILPREPKAQCLRLGAGWWTFRYCHGRAVEQFHEATEWSLGTLVVGGKRKERLTSELGYYTSHF